MQESAAPGCCWSNRSQARSSGTPAGISVYSDMDANPAATTARNSRRSAIQARVRRPITAVGSLAWGVPYCRGAVTSRVYQTPSDGPRQRLRGAERATGRLPPPMAEPTPEPELFDKVVNLCKRRGFVFPSAEIYGGFRSTYDYGPVGVLLLRNVKDAWWRSMVQLRHDVVGLDASILSPPPVWEASGHLANFTDPLVDCRECKERFRLDKLDDPETCPNCGAKGSFTEARQFNLMFKTHAGPVEGKGHEVFLRPETAQGMFLNFKNVLETSRKKPPFGIAQIGKSFRNEITPGNFVFRTREFEQMEMEFFVPPDEAEQWYEYWCATRYDWYVRPRDAHRPAAPAPARRRRAQPLQLGHLRRGVPVPVGLGRARGHRQPRRLRPDPARRTTRTRSSSTSTSRRTSATCPT